MIVDGWKETEQMSDWMWERMIGNHLVWWLMSMFEMILLSRTDHPSHAETSWCLIHPHDQHPEGSAQKDSLDYTFKRSAPIGLSVIKQVRRGERDFFFFFPLPTGQVSRWLLLWMHDRIVTKLHHPDVHTSRLCGSQQQPSPNSISSFLWSDTFCWLWWWSLASSASSKLKRRRRRKDWLEDD